MTGKDTSKLDTQTFLSVSSEFLGVNTVLCFSNSEPGMTDLDMAIEHSHFYSLSCREGEITHA
jgi:hypothetical protein